MVSPYQLDQKNIVVMWQRIEAAAAAEYLIA
jgi:hypothetical protein